MKKVFKFFAAVLLVSAGMAICSCSGDRMKTTESGLKYRFIELNKEAQQVQVGDVLVGLCTIRLDDSVLQTISTPDRLYPPVGQPLFPGDLNEGLLMMHIGDKAVFAVEADSLAKRGMRFPAFYKEGAGMKIYYEISIVDLVTKAEFDEEKANYYENLQQIKAEEKATLEQYVSEKKLKGTPNEDGLYIIVNKKGNGPKVEIGRNVAINYTGKFLDGKVFDTSVETVAKDNGVYDARRKYEPLKYKVGETSLIRGWEEGVINQPAGSKLTLVVPSEMGYGAQGMGGSIPPNSPLVFEIEIVSVN